MKMQDVNCLHRCMSVLNNIPEAGTMQYEIQMFDPKRSGECKKKVVALCSYFIRQPA